MRVLPLVLCLVLGLSGLAGAQTVDDVNSRLDAIFGGHETFADSFEALQAALAIDDRESIAALVRYPFRTVIDGERYFLESEESVLGFYDDLFTPEVIAAVRAQKYEELFVNQDGVMFGNGEVWMTDFCVDASCETSFWLISAINQPE